MVPLTPTAEVVLAAIVRIPGNPWVIAGRRPRSRVNSITAEWYRIRARAGLDDVRIHDLRHSCAIHINSKSKNMLITYWFLRNISLVPNSYHRPDFRP